MEEPIKVSGELLYKKEMSAAMVVFQKTLYSFVQPPAILRAWELLRMVVDDWHTCDEKYNGHFMSFGKALKELQNGKRIARTNWNGKDFWLKLQVPDAHSKMTEPYIYIEYPAGHVNAPKGLCCPWLASQTDILATDWFILKD
jgi:hypothetical protein